MGLLLELVQLLLRVRDVLSAAPQIPERPLVAPWYRIVRSGERLLFEHGHDVVAFEGAAATKLLPVLVPLLDGTRSVDEVVAHVGEAVRPAVDQALELFAGHGLLAEGPALAGDVPAPVRSAVYALAAGSRERDAVAAAARSLVAARVVVLGTSPIAVELARLLRLSGIGDVVMGGVEAPAAPGDAFVVAAPARAEVPRLTEWNRRALARSTAWMQVLPFDGRIAVVGPVFVPGETCCYTCYVLRRASNVEYEGDFEAIEAVAGSAASTPSFDAMHAGLAATTALRWIAGRDSFVPGQLQVIEPVPTIGVTAHWVLRVPRCPACSGLCDLPRPLPWHEAA